MSPTPGSVLRTFAAAAGWLACVMGAAHGQPLVGPALVAVILLAHGWTLADPLRQLRPVLVAGVVGTLLESGAIAAGAYVPQEAMRGTPFAPLWITALWINAAVFVQGIVLGGGKRPGEGEAPAEPGPKRLGGSLALPVILGAAAMIASYIGAAWFHAIAVEWAAPIAAAAAAFYGALAAPAMVWLIGGPQSRLIDRSAATSHESTHV